MTFQSQISTPIATGDSHATGARLVALDGRVLPLEGSSLRADARGGVARVVLEQRFRNPHAEPLTVTYSLPLPEDGAVSGFAFRVADERVVGVVETRDDARALFERAVAEGHSAALLEQDRGSLFTQEIGNVPPGATLVAEIVVDQKLRWLDEGAWEWRFPTVVGPRYLGTAGRVQDAARVTQDVVEGALGVRTALALAVRDALAPGQRPESSSHALRAVDARGGGCDVALAGDGLAELDRDVVVRWRVATPAVGVSLDAGRPAHGRATAGSSFGLLTVVPPETSRASRAVPRDLTVLIDASGSMGGAPLAQAARVAATLVGSLGARDTLELIMFATAPVRWKREPVAATEDAKLEALAWLRGLRAAGGTEMREGVMEALRPLRAESQRQVVLVTDGYIGFEREIVEAIALHLPPGARLHTLGVGAAVNRSLTGPAARAGRGLEAIVAPTEDPERVALRLLARTHAPLVVDLEIEGSALEARAPARSPDLFANAPALIALRLRPEGGELIVRGRTADGTWEQRLRVPALAEGEGPDAPAALFAREAVEDLELALAAGEFRHTVDAKIEALGVAHQIATRRTSWVAVSDRATVDPRAPARRERMPHALPVGVSAEGVGLRAAVAPGAVYRSMGMPVMQAAPGPMARPPTLGGTPPMPSRPSARQTLGGRASGSSANRPLASPPPVPQSVLGRARGFFLGGPSDAPRAEPMKKVDGAPTRPTWPALYARIVVRDAREIVLELRTDPSSAFEWGGDEVVELVTADGAKLACRIDAQRTTHAGIIYNGQLVRVTLVLDGPSSAVLTRVVLRGADGRTVEITLDA